MLVLNVPCSVETSFTVWSELTPSLVQTSELTPPLVWPLELTPPLNELTLKIEQTKITTMLALMYLVL